MSGGEAQYASFLYARCLSGTRLCRERAAEPLQWEGQGAKKPDC